MTSIGETLRRERLRRGLTLVQIAADTKIGLHLLEAMEADEFDRLPGGVFTRSFLRQYAHALGLDEEEVVTWLKEQFEEPREPLPAPPPEPRSGLSQMPSFDDVRDRLRSDSSLGALAWVVIVMLVCAGVYQLWQKGPRRLTPTQTAAAPSNPAPQSQADVKPSLPPVPEVSKPEFRPAVVSEDGTIAVPGASQPAVPREPGPTPETAGALRVAFTATEPVWVSIKSDGARAYSGTIDSRQSKQFDAARKMVVLVGNAGALKISLNGKPVGPFGSQGEIRLLMFTPEGAQVLQRTSPSSPPTPEDSTAAPPDEAGRR
ncbi:MAG TPA: RodZ domain-containing protein [Bryobacteraceae bacterium]|nr:RodZ domain-containing protein [Bryobacteraceae bacterium]